MATQQPPQRPSWQDIEQWWVGMAKRLGVLERGQLFLKNALGQDGVLERVERVGGYVHYILFVLLAIGPPRSSRPRGGSGRPRTTRTTGWNPSRF